MNWGRVCLRQKQRSNRPQALNYSFCKTIKYIYIYIRRKTFPCAVTFAYSCFLYTKCSALSHRLNEYSTHKADIGHSPGTVQGLENCKDCKMENQEKRNFLTTTPSWIKLTLNLQSWCNSADWFSHQKVSSVSHWGNKFRIFPSSAIVWEWN